MQKKKLEPKSFKRKKEFFFSQTFGIFFSFYFEVLLDEVKLLHNAFIRIPIASERILNSLIDALNPETRSISARTKIKIRKDEKGIILKINAEDTVALRSTLNAYTRWINSTLEVLNSINK